MFLQKISNKALISCNINIYNNIKYLSCITEILKFAKKEALSFYGRWLVLLIFINLYNLQMKANYFISYLYFSFFNKQKLVSYVISIKLFPTNTLINVNNIKGNPKFFCSAGMFNLQKIQKVRQPKASILILRALLLKFKIFKTKPVAVHFINLFFSHQSSIFKKLSRKIFTKLLISYMHQSHNGCRLKKKKRIKIRTRTRKL